jgi:hypothetical protein
MFVGLLKRRMQTSKQQGKLLSRRKRRQRSGEAGRSKEGRPAHTFLQDNPLVQRGRRAAGSMPLAGRKKQRNLRGAEEAREP